MYSNSKYLTETACVKYIDLPDKLVKDGKTAFLTSSNQKVMIDIFRYDPNIIKLLLDMKIYKPRIDWIKLGYTFSEIDKYNNEVEIFNDNISKQIMVYCETKYSFSCPYRLVNILVVNWIPENTFFMIVNCADNGESVVTVQEDYWTKA